MKLISVYLYYENGEHKTVKSYDTAAKVVRQEEKAADKSNPIVEAAAFTHTAQGQTHNATFKLYNGKLTNRNTIVKQEVITAIRKERA